VRSVVGSDTVDGTVYETVEEATACTLGTQWRVHLAVRSEFRKVIAGQEEVVGRYLTGMRRLFDQIHRLRMGYMSEMDGFVGDIDGAFDRRNLCLGRAVLRPDVGIAGVEVYVSELF
jgi:hypothetical protein